MWEEVDDKKGLDWMCGNFESDQTSNQWLVDDSGLLVDYSGLDLAQRMRLNM